MKSKINPGLAALVRPIAGLREDPDNAREHDAENVRAIAASYRDSGQQKPIVVMPDGTVVAGSGQLRAAISLGWDEIAVVPFDGTPEQAEIFGIADNRTAELATWSAALPEKLARLRDIGIDLQEHLAFSDKQIVQFLAGSGSVVEDEGPGEPPAEPVTRRGDLWLLGKHRLLCGDSTAVDDVTRLMDGHQAALIHGDPPYFRKIDEEWDQDFEGGFEGFLEFLGGVFSQWAPRMIDRGTAAWWCSPDYAWHVERLLREVFAVFNHIVWHKGSGLGTTASVKDMRRWRPRSERLLLCEKQHSPDALLASFNAKTSHIASRSAYRGVIDRLRSWFDKSGLTFREIDAVLGKNGMAGHYFSDSQWALPTVEAWEKMRPLFAGRGVDIGGWDAQRLEFDAQRLEFDAQRREFDAQRREFDAQRRDDASEGGLTDVWAYSTPSGVDRPEHPTPKPLAIMTRLVLAHTRDGDLIADPFAGSGSMLVAAERSGGGRRCFAMEISPAYCDVIVARWEKFTGKTPVRGV